MAILTQDKENTRARVFNSSVFGKVLYLVVFVGLVDANISDYQSKVSIHTRHNKVLFKCKQLANM